MTTINLHIEKLVLDGVAEHEGPRVGEAVTAELVRLFGEERASERLSGDRDVPLVRASPILRPESQVERLGTQIGQAIHGAISQ